MTYFFLFGYPLVQFMKNYISYKKSDDLACLRSCKLLLYNRLLKTLQLYFLWAKEHVYRKTFSVLNAIIPLGHIGALERESRILYLAFSYFTEDIVLIHWNRSIRRLSVMPNCLEQMNRTQRAVICVFHFIFNSCLLLIKWNMKYTLHLSIFFFWAFLLAFCHFSYSSHNKSDGSSKKK